MTDNDRSIWDHTDVTIKRKGTSITLPALPEEMPIPVAIDALHRKQADESQKINCIEYVNAFPLDGAVAFMRAMQEMFGWASPIPTPGFFGDTPPNMVGVNVSPTETVQVAFGRFNLPGLSGWVHTHADETHFVIQGEVEKRHAHIIEKLAEHTRKLVAKHSIYKGKALSFTTNKQGKLQSSVPPQFIETDSIDLDELILNTDVLEMVTTSVFTPVRYTEKCRVAKLPLNRGVLLEGHYGVGKTMIARCAAKVCEQNNWTFILLDKAQALKEGLLFAQRYAPAMVFCEDIDRITNERDDKANDLLNTIDGILTKNSEVIAVMTTNHVEKINPAMLRPGRLDSVITIALPDKDAVQQLIRVYARDMLAADEPLTAVGTELAGQIPATIREAVERSKLRAIPKINGSGLVITEDDLLAAAKEMKVHLALLKQKADPTGFELIMMGLNDILNDTDTHDTVDQILSLAEDINSTVN